MTPSTVPSSTPRTSPSSQPFTRPFTRPSRRTRPLARAGTDRAGYFTLNAVFSMSLSPSSRISGRTPSTSTTEMMVPRPMLLPTP